MRKITTKDGQVVSGLNSSFEDKGHYVEKQGVFTTTRIYNDNISEDKESDTAGRVATSVTLAILTGGIIS